MDERTYQIGDTVRVRYPEEASEYVGTEVPEFALYGGPDPFRDPNAEVHFVRIFYEIPSGFGTTTTTTTAEMVPLYLLEPAPHHFGDRLRELFFKQQSEIRYMLKLRHRRQPAHRR